VDIVIIAWDGRALGVPPFGSYNEPVLVPAGTPMEWSVARRFDCLVRSAVPVNGHAIIEFIDTLRRDVRFTTVVNMNIGAGVDVQTFAISGSVKDDLGNPVQGVSLHVNSLSLGGSPLQTMQTNALGNYTVSGLESGTYQITPTQAGFSFTPPERMVTLTVDGAIGLNFTRQVALEVGFSISGAVIHKRTGQPISGVEMTLAGATTATVFTDATGQYSFTGVADGRYTITPAKSGFRFKPPRRNLRMQGADLIVRDFSGDAAAASKPAKTTLIQQPQQSTTEIVRPISTKKPGKKIN
jgi:hypothetical protein